LNEDALLDLAIVASSPVASAMPAAFQVRATTFWRARKTRDARGERETTTGGLSLPRSRGACGWLCWDEKRREQSTWKRNFSLATRLAFSPAREIDFFVPIECVFSLVKPKCRLSRNAEGCVGARRAPASALPQRADLVRPPPTESMALSMTTARPAALSSRVQSGIASFRAPVAAPSRGSLQVMAASKKKDVRLTITLECTEQKASGVGGMSRYMSQKVRERVPGSFASPRRSRAAQRPTPGG
jgi:hypothetical protein